MRIHGKVLWLALVTAVGVFVSGCSGINTTQSVSPASFFLPGLMKADPPQNNRILKATPDPVIVVAEAR